MRSLIGSISVIHIFLLFFLMIGYAPLSAQSSIDKDSLLLEKAYANKDYNAVKSLMSTWNKRSIAEAKRHHYSHRDNLANEVYRRFLSDFFAGRMEYPYSRPPSVYQKVGYKRAPYFFVQRSLQYKFVDSINDERLLNLISYTEKPFVPGENPKTRIPDSIGFSYKKHDSAKLVVNKINAYKNFINTPVHISRRYNKKSSPSFIYAKSSYQQTFVHFWGYIQYVVHSSFKDISRPPDDKKMHFLDTALGLPNLRYCIAQGLKDTEVEQICFFSEINRVVVIYKDVFNCLCYAVYEIDKINNVDYPPVIIGIYCT